MARRAIRQGLRPPARYRPARPRGDGRDRRSGRAGRRGGCSGRRRRRACAGRTCRCGRKWRRGPRCWPFHSLEAFAVGLFRHLEAFAVAGSAWRIRTLHAPQGCEQSRPGADARHSRPDYRQYRRIRRRPFPSGRSPRPPPVREKQSACRGDRGRRPAGADGPSDRPRDADSRILRNRESRAFRPAHADAAGPPKTIRCGRPPVSRCQTSDPRQSAKRALTSRFTLTPPPPLATRAPGGSPAGRAPGTSRCTRGPRAPAAASRRRRARPRGLRARACECPRTPLRGWPRASSATGTPRSGRRARRLSGDDQVTRYA